MTMNTQPKQPPPPPPPQLRPLQRREGLIFAPLAWLKLQFFLHAGQTEIGGFGISDARDLLYIEEFQTVRQAVSMATVQFDDQAVADHFDRCVDEGIEPQRCGRIWIHTHPGQSPHPSDTDEQTFNRVFGGCDWSVMFIIGRTGRTYARLAFSAGPRGQILLPVSVDWERWPGELSDPHFDLTGLTHQWLEEYSSNIAIPQANELGLMELAWWEDALTAIEREELLGAQDELLDAQEDRALREVMS
jgi:hypothetical protein